MLKGVKKFKDEFTKFAMRGNVIDLAVGVIIGGAFGKITTSLVNDIIYPLLSPIMGSLDFNSLFIAMDGKKYETLSAVPEGVATLNYGTFLTIMLDFFIIALAIFIVIQQLNRLREKFDKKPDISPPPVRKCPYCITEIADEATRCPHCTSQLQ